MERIRKGSDLLKKKWGSPSIHQKYSNTKLMQRSSALHFVEFRLGAHAWKWCDTRVPNEVRAQQRCAVAMGANVLKVPRTWKIFSAYLKGLWKYRRMAFFFLNYLFSFYRYWRFCIMQIRSAMTSYCLLLKMIKYWINNISGNIKAVFLKLGTINVHHERNTMTPLMSLPWQQFGHWCCLIKTKIPSFVVNQEPSTPHNLLMGVKTIWELHLFQVTPFVSFQGLQMGIFAFWTERDGSRKSCYGNTIEGVILFLLWCSFMVPSFKNITLIFSEISFIQYFTIFRNFEIEMPGNVIFTVFQTVFGP